MTDVNVVTMDDDIAPRTSAVRCAPVLVLGIGNILMKDEGVGARAAQAMQELDLPEGIEVFDGATQGADLIDVLADREKVVVIDAVQAPVPAGTIMRFGSESFARRNVTMMSLHQVGILDALAMTRHMGCAPKEVIVIGVKPKEVSLGLELTEEIAEVVDTLVDLVLIELGVPV